MLSSFHISICGAPPGFKKGCVALNSLLGSPNGLSIISSLVTLCTSSRIYVPKENEENAQFQDEIQTLNYMVRAFRNCDAPPSQPEISSILESFTFLSKECIDCIVPSIATATSVSEAADNKSGQLINFKWKIGVALSSSRCSSLLAPYVGIAFDIKHSSGRVSSYTAELSYDEFKVFYYKFDEVGKALDSI